MSSHSDERLLEKPTRYFAVISQENLPQYIQTGFIGLTSVKDPIHDVQSKFWPKNVLFKNEIPKKAMEECGPENCVLQLSNDNFDFEQAVFYSKQPVSMTGVEKIIFCDETAISEFMSSYQQFSEIPFDFFEMVVEPSVFAASSEEFSFEFNSSEEEQKQTLKMKSALNLFVGVQATLTKYECFDAAISDGLALKFDGCSDFLKSLINSACQTIVDTTLNEEEDRVVTALSKVLFETELPLKINPNQFLSMLEVEYQNLFGTVPNSNFEKFLIFSKSVLSGERDLGDLTDKREWVLYRGIYLSSVCKTPDELLNFASRLRAGRAVTSIALLLVYSKMKYFKHAFVKKSLSEYRKLHGVSELIFSKQSVNIKVKSEQIQDNLATKTSFDISGLYTVSRMTNGDPVLRSLKEELRKLDFEPKINREPNLVGLQILVLDKNKAGTNDLNINFWNVPHPLIKSNVILIEARASKAKIRNDLTMSEHCQNVSKMGVISTFQNDEGESLEDFSAGQNYGFR